MARFETLNAILGANAREDRQITFVDGEHDQRVLSFRQLRQRAIAALGALERRGLVPGDTMILFLGDNERFVEMFWACVLGGIVPVPLAAGGTEQHWRKFLRVFEQLERVSVCIDVIALERFEAFVATHGLTAEGQRVRARAVVSGSLDIDGAPGEPVQPQPHDLAFIQYSSGSTGEPKGVVLTHRNVTTNIDSIATGAAYTERDLVLSWMPLSHDMGLIGFHLTLLAAHVSHTIMRTELFARRPLLWMELASQQRSTVLCSPNFGFSHYLRQHAIKSPQNLDLSPVRLIFNGAEPICADLCRRFTHTMAAHGLRPNSVFPVYGLAEATLAVSFAQRQAAVETLRLDRASLCVGQPVREAQADSAGQAEFVKVGQPLPGIGVRIADASGAELGARVLGHVLMRGDNVTSGYYRQDEKTTALQRGDGWVDTGDLGFFADGQLVITGRAKDLVIVNGQNYHPHDLERVAEQVIGIDANRVAAAGVRAAGGHTEELALFVLHRGELADFVPRMLELRRAMLAQTGLEAAHIVPVKHIPKTTSGKLQRYALVEAFERGEFCEDIAAVDALIAAIDAPHADDFAASPTVRRLQEICAGFVAGRVLSAHTSLLEIDLSSLSLARIHEAIDRDYPDRIEITDLIDNPRLEQLAALLDTADC